LKALVWSAALNAIVAGPVMVLVMRLGASKKVMGQFRVTGAWLILGWCATALMAIASLAFLISLVTDRH
jgi:Mn2+/Fe2+ NRAMP family transporter